jgi:hypothetical protein
MFCGFEIAVYLFPRFLRLIQADTSIDSHRNGGDVNFKKQHKVGGEVLQEPSAARALALPQLNSAVATTSRLALSIFKLNYTDMKHNLQSYSMILIRRKILVLLAPSYSVLLCLSVAEQNCVTFRAHIVPTFWSGLISSLSP